MSAATHFIGSKISLISKSDIRYEGILYTIDPVDCTIALAKVKSMGTEDRPTDRPVAPRSEVYEYIVFRGSDIRDIRVCQPPKPQPVLAGGLPNDPAILQHSVPGGTNIQNEATSSTSSGLGTLMSELSVAPPNVSTSSSGQSSITPALLPTPSVMPQRAASPTSERAVQVERPNRSSQQGRSSGTQTSSNAQRSSRNDRDYDSSSGNHYNKGYAARDHGPRGNSRSQYDSYHVDRRSSGYDEDNRRYNNQQGYNRPSRGGYMNHGGRLNFEDRRGYYGYHENPPHRGFYDNSYQNYERRGNSYGGRNNGQQRRVGNRPQWMTNDGNPLSGRDQNEASQQKLTFNGEFDFETANNEFATLKEKLSELKINNDQIDAPSDDQSSTTKPEETEKEVQEQTQPAEETEKENVDDEKPEENKVEEKSTDDNVCISEVQGNDENQSIKRCYDRTLSFFDNLSNVPPKSNNTDRNREVKLNLETFGERGRARGRRRGYNVNNASSNYNRNSGNYGLRGDFLYVNNYRGMGGFYNVFRGYSNRGSSASGDYRSRRFAGGSSGSYYRRGLRY